MARCIVELERIYGIKNGGNRGNQYSKKEADTDNLNLATQKDLAHKIGVSQQQLQDYKKLNNLIPELQELVEMGKITKLGV